MESDKMVKSKRIPIPEETRAKLFLWCARHCCFCGKACTTNMELHHINEDSSNNEEDNLIPVRFDCHGELPHKAVNLRSTIDYGVQVGNNALE